MTGRQDPELDALIAYWQRALRLLDWRITAFYVPDLCTTDGSPVYGLVSRTVDNKTATILIRDPSTPVEGAEPKAAEEIVIHELTHLHFAPFASAEPPAVAAEEQAVWALAEALYREKGSPNEQTIARAMVARVARGRTATERRMDPKMKKLLAALAEAEGMKDPEEARAAMKKAKAEYEAAEEPPEKGKEEPPPRSDREPAARVAEPSPPKDAKAARAVTLDDVRATSAETVQRAMREERARASLIDANASRMTAGQREIFAGMPIADVRAQIAALPAAPAAPVAPTPAGLKIEPLGGPAPDAATAAHLARVDAHMGIRRAAAPQAIEITPVGDLVLSHQRGVKLVPAAKAAT